MTSQGPLLGCIADDFTGATDLASMLVAAACAPCSSSACPAGRAGARRRCRGGRAQVAHRAGRRGGGAVLAALDWLRRAGCRQFFFKYCSTFDSTDAGQYRPGCRRAAGRARQRLRARLPGVPGQRAHASIRAICSSAARC